MRQKTAQLLKGFLFYLASISCLVFLSSCTQPTYPAHQVIQAVKRLCKDEYNLEVKVRIHGNTLGVSIPLPGLVDKDLRLDREAAKKIEQVALSLRRVILSTDRPIDFYIICAQDTKMAGAEYVMTGSTLDIKRVSVLDISRSEYLSRIQRDFRLNPQKLGEEKIRALFADLNKKMPAEFALAKYARFPISTARAQETFYPTILLAEPESIHYQIIHMQSKEVSPQEALFWIKTKETYQPSIKGKKWVSFFPPGFVNEYLIRIKAEPLKPIAEIVPKFFEQEEAIQQRYMAEIFARYKDLAILDREGLPKKEIDLMQFLTRQIARRLKEKLEEELPFKGNFQVHSITASFAEGVFKLNLHITGEEKEIFRQALLMVGLITRGYWLEDFTGVEITSQKSGKRLTLSKEKLHQFYRKKITLDELF